MELKLTTQGLLIYATLLCYALAFGVLVARRRKAGHAIFAIGFLVALAAYIYRWVHAGHVPLQNMFEVFLTLGALAYPLSLFYRYLYGLRGQKADVALGAVVLFPAGFVFSADPQMLPAALQSWLFVPHVLAYMLAYMILFKAGVQAGAHLLQGLDVGGDRGRALERATYRTIRLGFPLLTLGLLLGALWGKLAWGDYWNWDPKELWSFTTWLVYLGYLHFRYMCGRKYARVNSTLALFGVLCVLLTLTWVNLGRIFSGLHSYA